MKKQRKEIRKGRQVFANNMERAPWLAALNDPCGVHDVRIPDGQLMPTCTRHVKVRLVIDRPTGDPAPDFTWVTAQPASISARSTGTTGVTSFLNVTHSDGTHVYEANNTQLDAWGVFPLWAELAEVRVVSACLSYKYTGSTFDNAGVVYVGPMSAGQRPIIPTYVYKVADESANDISANLTNVSYQNQIKVLAFPLRQSAEAVYVPCSKEDLEFAEVFLVGNEANTMYLWPNDTWLSYMIYWGPADSSSQQVLLEYDINYEYLPRVNSVPGTAVVPFTPSVFTKVANWASNIGNIVRGISNAGHAVGNTLQMLKHTGVQNLPMLLRGSAGAGAMRALTAAGPTIVEIL